MVTDPLQQVALWPLVHGTAGTHLLMVTWDPNAASTRHHIRQYQQNPSQETKAHVHLLKEPLHMTTRHKAVGRGITHRPLSFTKFPNASGMQPVIWLLLRFLSKRGTSRRAPCHGLPSALDLAHQTDVQGHDNHMYTDISPERANCKTPAN